MLHSVNVFILNEYDDDDDDDDDEHEEVKMSATPSYCRAAPTLTQLH